MRRTFIASLYALVLGTMILPNAARASDCFNYETSMSAEQAARLGVHPSPRGTYDAKAGWRSLCWDNRIKLSADCDYTRAAIGAACCVKGKNPQCNSDSFSVGCCLP